METEEFKKRFYLLAREGHIFPTSFRIPYRLSHSFLPSHDETEYTKPIIPREVDVVAAFPAAFALLDEAQIPHLSANYQDYGNEIHVVDSQALMRKIGGEQAFKDLCTTINLGRG